MRLEQNEKLYIRRLKMAKQSKKLTSVEIEHLNSVIDGTFNYYINHIFPWMYEIIKNKTWYSKDIENKLRRIDPEWDVSYYVYPILEPNIDSFVANSFEIDTQWRPVAIKTVDANLVKDANDCLSWIESITNRKDIEDIMRAEATPLGTTYCKFWYVNKNGNKLPFATHVSFFELFVEPGARDFYESRYKIYRRIFSTRQIMDMYWKLITEKDKKNFEKKQWECFKKRDFNKIRELKFYEDSIESYIDTIDDDKSPIEIITEALENQFCVIDWENGNNEVVEIRDGWICHVYINAEYVTTYEEFTQAPFWCFVFERQPGTYLGRGLWHKLMPSQLEANFLYNSLRKWVRQNIFPDTMSISWAITDPVTWQAPVELYYQWGKNYNVNTTSLFGNKAFEKIQYTDVEVIQLIRARLPEVVAEAQMIAWTSSYTMWGQGKVERVSWGIAQKNSVFLARLQPMTASIKSMKSRAFHMWLEITQKIDKDLIYRISERWEESTIWDLEIKDILNKTYVWVDTETNKSIKRYENIQLWTTILWNLSPFAWTQDPEIQKLMTSTLKAIVKDYVFAWDEEKMEAEQSKWVNALQDTISQIKDLEQWNTNNSTIEWNLNLWQVLSGIPSDKIETTAPETMDFGV